MTPRRPIGGRGRKPSLKPGRARGARPARIHNAVSGHDVAERVDRAVEANDRRGTRPESPRRRKARLKGSQASLATAISPPTT